MTPALEIFLIKFEFFFKFSENFYEPVKLFKVWNNDTG